MRKALGCAERAGGAPAPTRAERWQTPARVSRYNQHQGNRAPRGRLPALVGQECPTHTSLVGLECPAHTNGNDYAARTNRYQHAYGDEVPRAVAGHEGEPSQRRPGTRPQGVRVFAEAAFGSAAGVWGAVPGASSRSRSSAGGNENGRGRGGGGA